MLLVVKKRIQRGVGGTHLGEQGRPLQTTAEWRVKDGRSVDRLQEEGQAQAKAWRQEQLRELKTHESVWLTLVRWVREAGPTS